METLKAYLQLARPANIITAVADILAGASVAGFAVVLNGQSSLLPSNSLDLFHLVIATMGLYGGGIVLNDVFDAELDRVERPERPIPSGRAGRKGATVFGIFLLLIGILAAYHVSALSGHIALVVAICAVLYDYKGKHMTIVGPINMALCRAGNLLLGISILHESFTTLWPLAAVPLLYITGVTWISRGEVHGSGKGNLYTGGILYSLAISALLIIGIFHPYDFWLSLPFLACFFLLATPPLFKAIKHPVGKNIGKTVKFGVLSLILLDATMAVGFGDLINGVVIVCLLPLSILLARVFAVT